MALSNSDRNKRYRERHPDRAAAHDAARPSRSRNRDLGEAAADSRSWYHERGGKAVVRKRQLLRMGFTPELFAGRLESQGGLCAICRQDFPAFKDGRERRCADHDHTTGKARGVLCMPCNTSLGHYEKHQRRTLSIQPYEDYLARYA